MDEVCRFIESSKISKVVLEFEDVMCLLKMLVMDGELESYIRAGEQNSSIGRKRPRVCF